MGRLQYINRKIEGVKLGNVVAKDLLKRIPPSAGSKAALRDPLVELDVSSKAINDEAAALIFDALARSIADPAGTTRLEELRLHDNHLTVACLKDLATVIEAASGSLQELDLGANSLSVESQQDIDTWEAFLGAFRKCTVLRKLDLSGNPLGPKAFAALTKVYLQEERGWERLEQTDGSALSDNLGTELKAMSLNTTLAGDQAKKAEAVVAPQLEKRKRSHSKQSSSLVAFYASSSGLRSVPYIILNGCGLTDECGLHLSYVIERHGLVSELIGKVPPARAGEPVRQLEAWDALVGCEGIIWTGEQKLSEAGKKVLQLAEQARSRRGDDYLDDDGDNETAALDTPISVPRKSIDTSSPFTPLTSRKRRTSVSTSHSTPHSAHVRSIVADPLRAARSRIQGDVLREHGPAQNELWLSSLRMLAIARPLLLQAMLTDVSEEPDDAANEYEDAHHTPIEVRRPPTPQLEDRDSPRVEEVELTNSPEANEALWPRLPHVDSGLKSRKYAVLKLSKDKDGQHSLQPELQTPIKVQIPDLELKMQFKNTLTPPQLGLPPRLPDAPYRSRLAKGLSKEVWGKILASVTGSDSLLSEGQQTQVVEYANSRASLRRELEVLGKPTNVQIWRALEGIGCLQYE